MFSVWHLLIAAFLTGAVFGATPSQAASFDCAKAKTPDETAICQDKELSALDSEMGALWSVYRQFPFAMGMSGVRQDEAEEFLSKRRSCGSDSACLSALYEHRISALRTAVKSALDATVQQGGGGPVPPTPSPEALISPAPEEETGSVPHALPAPVTALIAGYGEQCQQLDGRLKNPDGVRVLAGDLDDDGQLDYLLNTDRLDCEGAATAFCANAGCQIDILLSSSEYSAPVTLQGGVPTLVQSEKDTRAEIEVDRTNCENAGSKDACWAIYEWQDGEAKTRYEPRAQHN